MAVACLRVVLEVLDLAGKSNPFAVVDEDPRCRVGVFSWSKLLNLEVKIFRILKNALVCHARYFHGSDSIWQWPPASAT